MFKNVQIYFKNEFYYLFISSFFEYNFLHLFLNSPSENVQAAHITQVCKNKKYNKTTTSKAQYFYWLVLTLKSSGPYKRMFKNCFIKIIRNDETTVYIIVQESCSNTRIQAATQKKVEWCFCF